MSTRDVIAEFLWRQGIPRQYHAADRLMNELARAGAARGATAATQLTGFNGSDDAELLHEIANWLEETGGVLIGLWSTGFGGIMETHIQVVTDTVPTDRKGLGGSASSAAPGSTPTERGAGMRSAGAPADLDGGRVEPRHPDALAPVDGGAGESPAAPAPPCDDERSEP